MNLPTVAEVMQNRREIIRGRMKGYVHRNCVEMKKWHQKIVVEQDTMSDLEISNFASSNRRAAAAQNIYNEVVHSDTAEHFDETLAFLIRGEMAAGGSHEKLTVYLEAHQILTGEDTALGY